MRFLLLLTLLPLIHALFDDDPELSLSVHNAGTIDLRGVYLLKEATGEAADDCPLNVTHTTWKRISDGTIGLPHNTIVQDGERCESTTDERSLRFFQGTDYDDDFNPIGDDDPLPQDFVNVMTVSGFNVNARAGIREAGGRYLMGYESVIRVCGGMGKFGLGTTAFLMRPVGTEIVIKNLDTTLTQGEKYLLMVPRFRQTYCLYSSDVNGPDDAFRPVETDEVIPSESPVPTDEGGIDITRPPKPSRTPVFPPFPPGDTPFPTEETMEPSLSPSPVSGDGDAAPDEDDGICFPADATVMLEDGRRKRMDEIVIGDNIQVGHGKFSPVFAFTHNDASVRREFITLSSSKASITATVGHFIYINNRVETIETAKVGDTLTLASGETEVITNISKDIKSGLFNPQTMAGDIIVDGVRATTYTRTVDPRLAHAVLTPLRAFFKVFGVDVLTKSVPDLRAVWLRS